jgi:toxin YoeB
VPHIESYVQRKRARRIFGVAVERQKTLRRINGLIKDIQRNGFAGIGKPEPLRNRPGVWSRRINEVDRLVYEINGDNIEISQCKGHYDD